MDKQLKRHEVFSFQTYKRYEDVIAQENYKMLRSLSLIGALAAFVLFVLAFFVDGILVPSNGYIVLLAECCGIAFVCHCFPQLAKKYHLFCFYSLLITVLIGCILLGVKEVEHNAVSYIAFLIVLPLYVIDNPLRIFVIELLVTFIFVVATISAKGAYFWHLDVVNVIIFFGVSVFTTSHSVRYRLDNVKKVTYFENKSDRDGLTSLLNRGAFERNVRQYMSFSSDCAMMLLIDVDNFKSINDTYGHDHGDMALYNLAIILKSLFRQSDDISRFGGDEFAVFVKNVQDVERIYQKLDYLLDVLSEDRIGGMTYSISIGVSLFPKQGDTFEKIYREADDSLYRIKESGKGRYERVGE